MKERIEAAAEEAWDAFWDCIAERFPEVKTGDLDFAVYDEMSRFARGAVKHWIEVNEVEDNPIIEIARKWLDAGDYKSSSGIPIEEIRCAGEKEGVVTAYDLGHHSNVLVITIENGEVVSAS